MKYVILTAVLIFSISSHATLSFGDEKCDGGDLPSGMDRICNLPVDDGQKIIAIETQYVFNCPVSAHFVHPRAIIRETSEAGFYKSLLPLYGFLYIKKGSDEETNWVDIERFADALNRNKVAEEFPEAPDCMINAFQNTNTIRWTTFEEAVQHVAQSYEFMVSVIEGDVDISGFIKETQLEQSASNR